MNKVHFTLKIRKGVFLCKTIQELSAGLTLNVTVDKSKGKMHGKEGKLVYAPLRS